MSRNRFVHFSLLAALLAGVVGCKELPGTRTEQGAVIGGLGGAAVGAAVGGEKHRLLGAILGGALGAGGGYVIRANSDKITGKDAQAATPAHQNAQQNPATPAPAPGGTTACIKRDG